MADMWPVIGMYSAAGEAGAWYFSRTAYAIFTCASIAVRSRFCL